MDELHEMGSLGSQTWLPFSRVATYVFRICSRECKPFARRVQPPQNEGQMLFIKAALAARESGPAVRITAR